MVAWDIETEQAAGVLAGAARRAAGYEDEIGAVPGSASGAGGSVAAALTGLEGALGRSDLVREALGAFTQRVVGPQLEEVVGQTVSAVRGTRSALASYEAGQLQMAADAQRAAAGAPDPSPPGAGRRGGATAAGPRGRS